MPLKIGCHFKLSAAEAATFAERLEPHVLLPVEDLADAEVFFGQPDLAACLAAPRLVWIHVSSAGWDRFAEPAARAELAARGVQLSTSSGVYSEPCAQHLLALMLAEARRLPQALREQLTERAWIQGQVREASILLGPDATVALVGFGSIATRIAELLAPFGPRIIAVRRTPSGREPVPTVGVEQLPSVLPRADHVVDLLPGGAETRNVFDAALFASLKPGAVFYNIGRGSTVDETALRAALESGRLRAAYLDVAALEPLPPEHPLWILPNCFITPHSAGGHRDERFRLLAHFQRNLELFAWGKPLLDRVL